MIIRVECNSLKEKDILFDLMHLGKLDALFTRATMKGYLDESENREAEFVEIRFPDGVIDSQSEYSKFCKVMKFFLAPQGAVAVFNFFCCDKQLKKGAFIAMK